MKNSMHNSTPPSAPTQKPIGGQTRRLEQVTTELSEKSGGRHVGLMQSIETTKNLSQIFKLKVLESLGKEKLERDPDKGAGG